MGCLIKSLLGLGTVILLAVLLVFGLQWAVDSYAPSVAAEELESATGFRLAVDDLDLSLSNTTVRTQGLTLDNPEGWPEEEFIKIDDFYLDVNPRTLVGDGEVVVNELVLDIDSLVSVTNLDGQNNARIFIERLREMQKDEPEEEAQSRPYRIKRLVLKADTLRVVDLSKGDPKVRELDLAVNAEMEDVTDLTQAIRPILENLARAHADELGYALIESLGASDPFGIVGDRLSDQIDQLENEENVSGKARELIDALKSRIPQKSE